MNNPPFAIGQRVVALKTKKNSFGIGITKGDIYTVLYLLQCTCGCWMVNIGLPNSVIPGYGEFDCGRRMQGPALSLVSPSLIAPYDPPAVEIDEAIIDQAKELISVSETVAPVKEVVNN